MALREAGRSRRTVVPFLFHSIKLKRWVFLWFLGTAVLVTGLTAGLGHRYAKYHFRIPPLQKVEKSVRDHIRKMRPLDLWLILGGGAAMVFAFRRGYYAMLAVVFPGRGSQFMRLAYERARRRRGPRIVAIGGGTGLPNLLMGLKEYTDNLTAVVTVSDDGGSSGRLRRQLRIPPPGDLRNCLVALADSEPLMGRLLLHRFSRKGDLNGHCFGNLFLAALSEVSGDLSTALAESSRVLAVRGRVLPVTQDLVQLSARLKTGRQVKGETRIKASQAEIVDVELVPSRARANPEVLKAIERADIIVYGPGSLYTSIVPNLLVPGMRQAISESKAIKVYVCNIMTEQGETGGFSAADHLDVLLRYAGEGNVDGIVLNSEKPSESQIKRYHLEGANLVEEDEGRLQAMGVSVVRGRLLSDQPGYLRHDPAKLSRAVIKYAVI